MTIDQRCKSYELPALIKHRRKETTRLNERSTSSERMLLSRLKIFFWDFVGLEPSGTWSPRWRESNALAGYTTGPSIGPVVYPANAFDSRQRGDIRYRLVQVRQNLKTRLFGLAACNCLSLFLPLSFSPPSYFLSFSIQKWDSKSLAFRTPSLLSCRRRLQAWRSIAVHRSRLISLHLQQRRWMKPLPKRGQKLCCVTFLMLVSVSVTDTSRSHCIAFRHVMLLSWFILRLLCVCVQVL